MTKAPTLAPSPAAAPPNGPAFSTLALDPPTLENLTQLGYLGMTPIQAASLPSGAVRQGRDRAGQDR